MYFGQKFKTGKNFEGVTGEKLKKGKKEIKKRNILEGNYYFVSVYCILYIV